MSLSFAWEWAVQLGADIHLVINPLHFNNRLIAGLLFSYVPQTLMGKASYIQDSASDLGLQHFHIRTKHCPLEAILPVIPWRLPPPGPSPGELIVSTHFTNDEDAVFQRNTLSKGPLLRDGGYLRRNWMGSKPGILLSSDISQRTGYVTSTATVSTWEGGSLSPQLQWAFIEGLTTL